MLSKPNLLKLVKYKRLDANALFVKKRYAASIYMAGYAIELALKYRICKTLCLSNGFPENRTEFDTYRNASQVPFWRTTITDIRQIRNHDLIALLFYSGKQLNIEDNFSMEWNIVNHWSETLRYSVSVVRANNASSFLNATHTIVAQLM